MEDRNENLSAFFVESMVSAYLYVMVFLTDFWGENPFREYAGSGLVAIVGFSVFVNVAKLVYNVFVGMKEYYRLKRIAGYKARFKD